MKVCSRCIIEKDESEFSKNNQKKDGKDCYCKTCKSSIGKLSYANNKGVKLEYSKSYYNKNRDKRNAQCREWQKKHKENVCAAVSKYRRNHKDKVYTYNREYRVNNTDKVRNWNNEGGKRSREALKDYYIIDKLKQSGCPKEQIELYPQLVELKKLEIKTKRFLKQAI